MDKRSVGEGSQVSSIEAGNTVRITNLPEYLPPLRIEPVANLDRSKPDGFDCSLNVKTVRRVAPRLRCTCNEIERSRSTPEPTNI